MIEISKIYNESCFDTMTRMDDNSIHCCITSPPYWGLRDYGTATWIGGDKDCDHLTPRSKGEDIRNGDKQGTNAGSRPNTQSICHKCGAIRQDAQLGLEATPEEYVANMVAVFREVRRVLRPDGTLWLVLGDSYAGSGVHAAHHANPGISQSPKRGCTNGVPVPEGLKPKDLVGIPWRVAFALQADGWYLRQDIIWHKPNPMPESVTDRPTKSHEYVFLLSKSGTAKLWVHRDKKYSEVVYELPEPDYRWTDRETDEELAEAPADWKTATYYNKDTDEYELRYRRFNLWRGCDYYYDNEAIKEPVKEVSLKRAEYGWHGKGDHGQGNYAGLGHTDKMGTRFCDPNGRNKRSVWTVATQSYPDAHFATYPEKLIEPCVLAGCPRGGVIYDPFMGSGTTGLVAKNHGRRFVGSDLNSKYCTMADRRVGNDSFSLFDYEDYNEG